MSSRIGSLYAFNRAQWVGLALGGVATLAGAYWTDGLERSLFTGLFGGLLTVLAVIDARRFILPDALTLALAICGALMIWRLAPQDAIHHLIGACAGFCALFALEIYYRRVRGIDGLGRGDAKLVGAIGLWIGWTGLPSALLLASASGVAYGAVLALRGTDIKRTPIPFGPFLAAGGFWVWLFGPIGLAA